MLNHVMVGSNDIERSKRFYEATLAVFGAGAPLRDVAGSGHVRYFFRHDGSSFVITQPIDDAPATPGNGTTVAFRCTSPEQVLRFHEVAVANGATSIEAPPGPRARANGAVHLAYVRDPDGNKLCGIFRET